MDIIKNRKLREMSTHAIEFTNLPLEVIEQIVSYLSVNDLLTCSLVSVGWREALNNNIFWVKRCEDGYRWKPYAEYLENKISNVEPEFEIPQCSEGTLEPLCAWRVHFNSQNRYKKILHTYKCKKYSVEGQFNTDGLIYYDAENIVLVPANNSYEVWNTQSRPFCEDIIYWGLNYANQYVHVYENFIVILQLNLLQVYENSDGKFKLLHRLLFDEHFSVDIPLSAEVSDWYWKFYNKNLIAYPASSNVICFKNIFIGFNCQSDLRNCIFHVWDFKKGIKLKEETFGSLSNVYNVMFYKTAELLYVIFETENLSQERQTTILGYDAITQNYTKLCFEIDCSPTDRYFFFEDNYAVTIHSKVIDVWDVSKVNKHQTYVDPNSSPFPLAVVILKNRLIYSGNGNFAKFLIMLDLDTLQLFKRFSLSSPIYRLLCSRPNLLLIKTNSRGSEEYQLSIFKLKDSYMNRTESVIHSFKVKEQFSGTLKLAKLISVQPQEFCVTHFW